MSLEIKYLRVGKLNINVSSLFAARLSFRMPLNFGLTMLSAESQTATKMIIALTQIYLSAVYNVSNSHNI